MKFTFMLNFTENKKYPFLTLLFFLLFLLVSNSAFALDKEAKQLARYMDRVIVTSNVVVVDPSLNRRVSEIGQRIIQTADMPNLKCTFRIINNPGINAYTAGGEFVYINTGLLDILESEDEVAAVIAHELGHICRAHPLSFYKSSEGSRKFWSNTASLVGGLLSVSVSNALKMDPMTNPYSYNEDMFLLNAGLSIAVAQVTAPLLKAWQNGYGKSHECEADDLSVIYLHKAGYDPRAFLSFLKKIYTVREKLELNKQKCVSHVINAEPGIEEREKRISEKIQEIITQP